MTKKTPTTRTGLLSILIPVYNERAYLRRCVERVMAAPLPDGLERELILVDDGSTDGADELVREIAADHPDMIRAFFQEENQGKGAAIRRAIEEMNGQYAIFQDADLEYDPNEYGAVLKPLLDGHADVVYGSRFAASSMRQAVNYHHALGNMFLTHLSNMFTGLYLTDMETCYKAFRADVLKTIPIRSNRFGLEPEITAKIAKRHCAVYETPISYRGRSYAEGKKIGWKDGFSALATILKYALVDDCFDERYGQAILESLSGARRFNQWMSDAISPYLGERILEIGSGIGNLSRMLPKKQRLTVTDIDPVYLDLLETAYRDNDLVDTAQVDLDSDEDFAALGEGAYDTIVCLNVLEHIEDDLAAIKRAKRTLAPGGKLVLLVPQFQSLYGSYDKQVGHYRRYSRKSLRSVIARAGLEPIKVRNFNALGIPGWWFNARILQRERLGKVQLKMFDLLVPFTRVAEAIIPAPGLSLIGVGRMPGEPDGQ